MGRSALPEWRLPPGVTSGLWDYFQADHIADDYDEYFAYNQLFRFDDEVLARHFTRPGLFVDLGCGTGRLVESFARRGFPTLAIDLSLPMLRVVGRKAEAGELAIDRVLANMVELDCLADSCADYCAIMFSSLGMIVGAENRARVLRHARRILKPQGRFALHVHNRWQNLFDPQGRRWLAHNALRLDRRAGMEPGDKVYAYRGIPQMRLHLFTWGELKRLLRSTGFAIETTIPLDVQRQRELPAPWLFGRVRANGWIVICRPA